MPSGLDIDHEKPLSGTMPPYVQHVVIRTGKNDWSSKIEDEPDTDIGGANFARELKMLVGRGGKFHDVCGYTCLYHQILNHASCVVKWTWPDD